MSLTAARRTAGSGLASAKRASAVRSDAAQAVVGADLRQLVRAARCRRRCSVTRIERARRPASSSADRDDDDLLVRVADVQPIFEQRASAPARALAMAARRSAARRSLPCRRSWRRAARRAPRESASSGDCADEPAQRANSAASDARAATASSSHRSRRRARRSARDRLTCSSVPSTPWSWCCSCRTSASPSRPRCPCCPAGSPTRRRPAPCRGVFQTTSNWPSARTSPM